MIPTLSYREIVAGGAGDELDAALADPGAFRLADVPTADGLLPEMHEQTRAFFALPYEVKEMLRFPADQYTGWCGGDYLRQHGSRDHKEMFHVGPRVAPTLAAHDTTGAIGPITAGIAARAVETCPLWPATLPTFIDVWHRYYRHMQQVSAGLGAAMADILGVARAEWFATMGDNWADLAANFYPPVPVSPERSEPVYNAAHRDLTVFTLLHQDDSRAGGLSVELSDGTWSPVGPVADTYVVNVGELLAYLSGDRWTAARHQVTVASEHADHRPRISVPFFYRPSDTRVVSSFVDEQAIPVPVGQWVLDRKAAVSRA